MGTRTRATILILTACAALPLVLVMFSARDTEPRYAGRRLSSWVAIYGQRTTSDPEPAAEAAIRQFDTNALPHLLSWIHHEEKTPAVKRACQRILQEIPRGFTPEFLDSWAYGDRLKDRAIWAVEALALLGPRNLKLLPQLAVMMNDTNFPMTAWYAQCVLARMGKEALPYLIQRLQDTDTPTPCRLGAIDQITSQSDLVANAAPAIPALIRCLQETDPKVQGFAAYALGKIHLEPETVVPLLTRSLRTSTNPFPRRLAANALGDFGSLATNALPEIRDALTDPDEAIRNTATDSLYRITRQFSTNALAR